MTLIDKTISALCYILVREHSGLSALLDGRLNHCERFIRVQLSNMPDYLHIPFRVLTLILTIFTFFKYGKVFHHLDDVTKHRVLTHWRSSRLGFRRDLIRAYQTLVVFDLAHTQDWA